MEQGKDYWAGNSISPKDIWSIRVVWQMQHRAKELAFFNLGFDSKLRGRDLVGLRVRDLCHSSQVAHRAIVIERKTHRPVQFEITQKIYQRKPRILDEGGRT